MLFESQMSNILTIPDKLHKKFHRICLRSEVKKKLEGSSVVCFQRISIASLKVTGYIYIKQKFATFQSFNKTRDYTELRLGLFALTEFQKYLYWKFIQATISSRYNGPSLLWGKCPEIHLINFKYDEIISGWSSNSASFDFLSDCETHLK